MAASREMTGSRAFSGRGPYSKPELALELHGDWREGEETLPSPSTVLPLFSHSAPPFRATPQSEPRTGKC